MGFYDQIGVATGDGQDQAHGHDVAEQIRKPDLTGNRLNQHDIELAFQVARLNLNANFPLYGLRQLREVFSVFI